MIDKDGSISYSKVVRIIIQNSATKNSIQKLYPTVFSGNPKLTAVIESTSEKVINVQILNSNGKLISNQGKYDLVTGLNTIEIHAKDNLPQGILLIRIQSKDFESTKMVIKQ